MLGKIYDGLEEKIDLFLLEAQKYCNVKFAYLFGSYARGENNKTSDIDFAFMIERNQSKIDEIFARGNIIEAGKKIFKIDVDIVFLNNDIPLLKYQVIKDGIVVKDHHERADFESLSIREFFDFKYYSDYYDECLMVKREVVLARLGKLNEYISFLNNIGKYSKEEYAKDPFVYGSTERFLHLAIECVLDISNHVISDMRFRKPDNNRDVFEVLFENKIIDKNIKNNLCNMAGFRNILVHDYIKLDREIVYDIIINNLVDIKEFIIIVSEYI